MLPTVKISFFQKTNSLPAWPAAATFDAKSSQKLLAEWRQRATQVSLHRACRTYVLALRRERIGSCGLCKVFVIGF